MLGITSKVHNVFSTLIRKEGGEGGKAVLGLKNIVILYSTFHSIKAIFAAIKPFLCYIAYVYMLPTDFMSDLWIIGRTDETWIVWPCFLI